MTESHCTSNTTTNWTEADQQAVWNWADSTQKRALLRILTYRYNKGDLSRSILRRKVVQYSYAGIFSDDDVLRYWALLPTPDRNAKL